MSDFIEEEAELSEHEGSDEEEQEKKPVKKKKHLVDSSEEEDDDDDEEKLRYEMKDLINDEEEEVEDSDDDVTKRKHDESEDDPDDLDDEDLDLLEENLGTKIARRNKKYKRVKRQFDDDSDKETENVRDAIANELFDGDDEPTTAASEHRDNFKDEIRADLSSESEDEDDFIVDDEGLPISRPRKKKSTHRYTDEAMQQAQDIFGVDFDFDDIDELDEYEEDVEDEEYEDENEDGERVRKKKGKRGKNRKSIYEIYEPSELERSHLTDADTEIKQTDFPERFQTRSLPVHIIEEDDPELWRREATWIHKYAFSKKMLTKQGYEQGIADCTPLAGEKPASVIPKIADVIKSFHWKEWIHEVPFIAFYRKEMIHPDLNINDLWTIYKYDEKFWQLEKRKNNMIKLFKNMQEYQARLMLRNPDLDEKIRLLGEDDINAIRYCETFEALNDIWIHFQLYYGTDVKPMKQELMEMERDRRRQLREKAVENGEEPPEEEDEDAFNAKFSSLKLDRRKDPYTICKESGIMGMVEKFGLKPEQLAENMQEEYQKHEVVQCPMGPAETALDYIGSRFTTVESVLAAARFAHARQIASDPQIRATVRQKFEESAVVQVRPTKKGLKEKIDEHHPCYPRRYLKNKPISDFVGDHFLHLLIAEQDGLLDVRVTLDKRENPNDPTNEPKYLKKISTFYERDEYADNVQKWNKERYAVLEIAFEKYLYPQLEKEIKAKMRQEAISAIIKKAASKLNNWIRVAPYNVDASILEDEDFDTRDGVRVMGFAFLPGTDQAAYGAIIDGDGETTDYIRLPNFMIRKHEHMSAVDQQLRNKDHQRLRDFILAKKPHVIAVGSETIMARNVHSDITDIVQHLVDNESFPAIHIEIIDNDLSSVYMTSRRGKSEFPEYPELLRQAISLARRLQDPLIEFSQLCTPEEEILCLKYHPLQEYLPKDQLLEALNYEFINTVNEVGVDVNRALAHPHTSNLVQFICGLGPRKASSLLRMLKKQQTPLLESRTQLIVKCKFGAKVFINCAGFIKIDTAALTDASTDVYIEVLDSTRVHPEAYEWARKMAVDALEYDEENETNPAGALEEILESPEKLTELDLDAFAKELENQGFGPKQITLYDIRSELSNRYKDMRAPFQTATMDELFEMMTRETPESLYTGKLVTGNVVRIVRRQPNQEQFDQANPIRDEETQLWKCPFCSKNDFPELSDVWNHFDAKACPGEALGVMVRFDNGISGFCKTEKLSDHAVADPADRVTIGMTVHARILAVRVDKFSVDLTCRSSDLNDIGFDFRPRFDQQYYDHAEEKADEEREKEQKKKAARATYTKRIIVHPAFHNVDFKRAEQKLRELDQGEAIIRPSSKGQDHLTLTWKVTEGINQHIDIKEEGKDNPFSLGSKLYINGEAYEDLDEILARFVQPMASFVREILSFKYYKDAEGGNRDILTKILDEEKRKAPSKIPYFISASKMYPGKFVLAYQPRNSPVFEYVSVTPEGFKYRTIIFRSINKLFTWFKAHFRDPQPRSTPMVRATPGSMQQARATPMQMGAHRTPMPRSTPMQMSTPMQLGTPMQIATPIIGTPGPYRATPSQSSMARY